MTEQPDNAYYAAQRAILEYEAQKKYEAERITGATVFGVLVGAAIPAIGILMGLFHLVNGRGTKALYYFIGAIAVWGCTFVMLMGGL